MPLQKRIKVTPLDKKHKRTAKILEKYFRIATPKELERIKFEIFDSRKKPTQRRKAFKKHQETILKLKPLFKQLVIERNKSAQKDGYKNYFEFITKYDGVPKNKWFLFLKNADKVIRDIHKDFPFSVQDKNLIRSKFNIPNFLSLVPTIEFSIPDDIYTIFKKKYPYFEEIIPKIKITEIKNFTPMTHYDPKTKTVTFEVSTQESTANVLSFVHELGHVIAIFKCFKKGIDPIRKGRYWHEREAIKTLFEFENFALPQKTTKADRARALGDFLTTFFEYEIYSNPNPDFDKAYANAINRSYPLSREKENPLYVLENNLVLSPCLSVIVSVVETELLLKN